MPKNNKYKNNPKAQKLFKIAIECGDVILSKKYDKETLVDLNLKLQNAVLEFIMEPSDYKAMTRKHKKREEDLFFKLIDEVKNAGKKKKITNKK
jgi:hypothetical protein